MGSQWKAIERRLGDLLVRGKESEAWSLVEAVLRRSVWAASALDRTAGSDGLEFVSRATQLAAQYDAGTRALGWIADLRRRQEGSRRLSRQLVAAFQALEFGVQWVSKDYSAMRRIEAEIRWDDVPHCAWSLNLRLASAIGRNRREEVRDLVRGAPLDAEGEPYGEAYHRGTRLSLLGFHEFERGHLRNSLRYFRRAFRELAADGTFDARLKQIGVFGYWGRAAFREGNIEESADRFKRAVRSAARCRHGLWFNTFRVELAHVFAHRGEYLRAERMTRSVARHCKKRRHEAEAYDFLLVRSLLSAGGFAVDEGDLRRARRYERRATRCLVGCSHPRLPGYLHLLRGRIRTFEGTSVSHAQAREEFARAESCFRSFGDDDATGLTLLYFYRGHLHIQRRDVKATLDDALQCVELARSREFLPAKSSSLLLRSQLLLQREIAGADRLYEEVLRDLGSVHDPVVLFRVIANLYLYSWELGEQLELTDFHMQQIAQMKDLLDDETFHCLYERFVTRPVARRALRKTFGLGPDDS